MASKKLWETSEEVNQEVILKIRVSRAVADRLQWLADTYAGGNLSLWLRYAGLEAPRVYLTPHKKKS